MTYHERYRLEKNDPTKHVSTQTLRDLLDKGVEIKSQSLGRFGYVTEISRDSNLVTLKTTPKSKTRFSTTFHRGDPVELVMVDETHALIKNPDWVIDGLFRMDEEMDSKNPVDSLMCVC
jgi:hypothetical protein